MSKFTKALEQAERDREGKAPGPLGPGLSRPVEGWEPPRKDTTSIVEEIGQPTDIDPNDLDDTLQSLREVGTVAAEQYRALRNSVEEAAIDGSPLVLAVSSPGARDGKTVTSINLAGTLAQSPDSRVLLVDLDLRRPSILPKLGIREHGGSGLADAIRDSSLALRDIVRVLSKYNLSFIPSGRAGHAPYELLRSPRLAALLQEAKRHFQYIILDAPPLVPVADCRLIERLVDRVIVVVAASRTPRSMLEEALRLLDPEKLLGFVFNDAELDGATYYSGYNYVSKGSPPPSLASRLAARLHLR